jgi:integrase
MLRTSGKNRQIAPHRLLSDLALEALDLLPRALTARLSFFPGPRGGKLDLAAWRRRARKDALADAGVSYRAPYGMRDTYPTLNLNDGSGHKSTTAEL